MPTYDYDCTGGCGGFDAFRSLSARNDPAVCPSCGGDSPRVFASPPRLACVSPETRRAHETNERAAHAPQSSGSYQRMKHPSGCGCCSSSSSAATRKTTTVTAANGAKSFPNKRPWMISH
jgi:putative FmdB family regulatory protein